MKHCIPVLLAFFITSCAALDLKPQYPGMVTQPMQAEFNQIEQLYQNKNYDQAFAAYSRFIQSYEYNQLTDEAFYKQGKIYFVQNQMAQAALKFSELASKSPNAVYQAKGYHMAGYSYFKLDQFDAACKQLKKTQAGSLPAKLRVQYFSVAVECAQKVGDADFESLSLLNLYNLYQDAGDAEVKYTVGPNVIPYSSIQNRVDAWLNTPIKISEISTWMKKFPQSPAKAYVDFKIAFAYYNEKALDKARKAFSQFLTYFPKHELAPRAKKIVDELGGPLALKVTQKIDMKLGVLITATESGNAVLNGVRCAVGDNNVCSSSSGVTLVIRDTGENQETLKLAMQDLEKQNVSAIVAIPSKDLAVETAVAASEKKIPVFMVSQKEGLMTQSDYVFQFSMQAKQQMAELVSEAMNRGHKRFGMFYPNISYGQTMAELFAAEVKSRGGQLIVSVEYPRDTFDFFSQTRRLKDELAHTAGIDALFIPESFKIVNVLVSALEYSNIKGISLLGTNAWNDASLTLTIADLFPGSFFVDFYDANSTAQTAIDFKQRFAASFGHDPRVLEAYGYDIASYIQDVASKSGTNNIKEAVLNAGGYSGVTGVKGFRAGEGPIIDPVIMKIRSTGIGE